MLFSYCRARTGSKEEAEDLSQDIILELLKTRENLRDDKAFYGFMWAVAGNVYKNWCKKRAKNTALGGANCDCDMEKVHSIWNAVDGNLLAQNILFACYNDRCNAEEISLQIGGRGSLS